MNDEDETYVLGITESHRITNKKENFFMSEPNIIKFQFFFLLVVVKASQKLKKTTISN